MTRMRVLHFSDVHVEDGFEGVRWWRFLNKRLIGLANQRLRRGASFARAAEKVRALGDFAEALGADVTLGTGDFTVLGTPPELRYARDVVSGVAAAPLGLVVVPGNHDLYIEPSAGEASFAEVFDDLLRTDLPELAVDGPWPFVRLFGAHLAIVGVNSARPNPQIARSSGRIPDAQLEALPRVLSDPRVRTRFVLVATHYAPRLWDGSPDRRLHGLENADGLLAACAPLEHGAIVHGHVHRPYRVRVPDTRLPLFCAGSSTQEGRGAVWVYDIDAPDRATATRGQWTGERYELQPETREALFA